MAVQQDDLLKSVIRQRPSDIEHLFDERRVICVNRSRKIHHMSGVAIRNVRQDKDLVGKLPSGPMCDSARTDQINIQRQVVTVLLNGTTRKDANLPKIDRIVYLGPGQFLITILRGSSGHDSFSYGIP